MSNTCPPPVTPCTCLPYPGGHHGILLHADQVDDLVGLLATIDGWLTHASGGVYPDLHQFLSTAHRPDPARQLIAGQLDDLLHRLTTTPRDWLPLDDDDLDQLPTPPHQSDPVEQLLEQLAATTARLTRAGRNPRLARTPC
jgi:hypothetical protein